MTINTRFALTTLAVVSALAVTAAAPAEARPTRSIKPAAQCHAEVRIWEDGTWSGTNIYAADGHLIAPSWDVTGPEQRGLDTTGKTPVWHTNFKPTVDGRTCVLVVSN